MANKKECNSCEQFKTMIGGQALIEGIMMRGPEIYLQFFFFWCCHKLVS